MTGKILTIAQQKGGAGKSTLAAHLALAWALKRKSVALVDIDPQQSLAAWYDQREITLGADQTQITFASATGWRAAGVVEKLAKTHDYVLIDSPPHADTDARVAVRAADLVLVPVQPSPLDVWATLPTLEMAVKEKSAVLLVLNRVPPRANLTAQMITKLGGYKVTVAKSTIGNRVAFADAMVSGRTALETKASSVAAKELRALANELSKAL
ncbi:MAG: cobyrinic acid a,c-diamide synthase [Rhodospirillaceae bacterium]|jgi:chromosome partitioning protein|uniref:ParA family partition ATPase n=1 Tax=unclassified Hwanghaeella TaxID=2605944 RepID=UPI000C563535|nr:cobyrinic acid a,c-diamide synthase [Rhodospirillales bacterium]MAX48436.1 cobyrinic acid a,c-diamide synthase [Rhodospirillaceae bacterium]|tara:strand:- start:5554 stop:6189 length:636 start_codon:yes stop_codon:yes gene_type:complete